MKKYIVFFCVAAALLCLAGYYRRQVSSLSKELSIQQANVSSLLNGISSYKINDSLQAAQVEQLTLSLAQYEKAFTEDEAIIASLKCKSSEIQTIERVVTNTEYIISAPLDSIGFTYTNQWLNVTGTIRNGGDSIRLDVSSCDSIIIISSVKHKRFLGFLWKTKAVKSRKVDIVSKNPHTTIADIQWVNIKQ